MYRCPKCKDDNLEVQITTWARFTQDEDGEFSTDPNAAECCDHEWDERSQMRCRDCDHYGTAGEFEVADAAREED